MREVPYDRAAAVAYARRWALGRNPVYYDFENIGGDCTNFASQCICAGSGVMNETPVKGWYYHSLHDRSPSWTGVEFLYDFLLNHRSVGPYAREVTKEEARPGDIVQLGRNGDYYHTPVITSIASDILVAAHTYDALDRPLSSYRYEHLRILHIIGVRVW